MPLERPKEKIRAGVRILREHGIEPEIFFAPAHTFDENTLIALKEESDIRIISDTIANDVYFENGFYFIPQQSGRVRKLPFKTVTFCYHPNMMKDGDFEGLKSFISQYSGFLINRERLRLQRKELSLWDVLLRQMYFLRR